VVGIKKYTALTGTLALACFATACGGAGSSQSETNATTTTTSTATTTPAVDPIRHAFDSETPPATHPAAAHVAATRPRGTSQPVPPAVDGFAPTGPGERTLAKGDHPRHATHLTLGTAPTLTYDAGLSGSVTITHGGLDGQPGTLTDEPDGSVAVHSTQSTRVVFFVPSEDGVEDFTYLAEQPSSESLDLQLTVPAGAGLRLVDGELELLDGTGTPHIRLAPPRIYFGDGDSALGSVALPDCDHDTSPAGPWGRAITPANASGTDATCTVDIRWADTGVTYPALVDPSWTSAGSMSTARWAHTATVLSSGRVLVAGGITGGAVLGSAEIYDPTSNTWASTGSMQVARASHTATSLASGATILVAGGDDNTQALASAETYSTSSGTWTSTGAMTGSRDYHNAWAIDSTHVLVAGGTSWTASTWNVLATSAIFTSTSNTWAATGSLVQARVFAMSTSYGTTPVVAGGDNGSTVLATSETYSTTLNAWGMTLGQMTTARENAVLMMSGSSTATVFGGTDYSGNPIASTESLGLLALAWTGSKSLGTARGLAAIASYGSAPLVIGGGSTSAASLATTEQFNSAVSTVAAGPTLTHPRWGHTATALSSGHVLVTGGLDPSTNLSLASAELL
jgi:hypothetical protein